MAPVFFRVGSRVEVSDAGKWVPGTITKPLYQNTYTAVEDIHVKSAAEGTSLELKFVPEDVRPLRDGSKAPASHEEYVREHSPISVGARVEVGFDRGRKPDAGTVTHGLDHNAYAVALDKYVGQNMPDYSALPEDIRLLNDGSKTPLPPSSPVVQTPPVPPRPAAAPLPAISRQPIHLRPAGTLADGLYLRTKFSFNGRQNQINLIYVSGDHIAWNATGGVDPFDFAAAERENPKNIGRFRINGDTMEVVWGGATGPQVMHLEVRDGRVSVIDGGGIVKADAYPRDARLEATFGGTFGTERERELGGGSHPDISVSSSATLSFTKSGQFTFSHLGAVRSPRYDGTVETARPGAYQLSGNTLTLRFPDGRTERNTVLPFNVSLDPAHPKLSDESMIYGDRWLTRER